MARPKTCKNPSCKAKFTPSRPMQTVCCWQCAQAVAERKRELIEQKQKRIERQATREKKEKLKSRTQWLSECKEIAQKIARLRDFHDGCISCDKPSTWHGQWHGSHFRPAGNFKAVALNLFNIHKACSQCNSFKSGNLTPYEDKLRLKIGDEKVDWLKSQTAPHTHRIEYLMKYKRVMGKKARLMEKRLGIK